MKRLLILTLAAIVLGSCAVGATRDTVTGTFGRGNLIALDEWTGSNSVGSNLDAYASVPDGTAATLELTGPQVWSCRGVFRNPVYVPATGGPFESDQDRKRDIVVVLPSLVVDGETAPGFTLIGPGGTYRVTIAIPAFGASFSHSWKLGTGSSNAGLYTTNPGCTQIATSLAQQQKFVDAYLMALQSELNSITMSSLPARAQLKVLLDQATVAKRAGDAKADPDQRASEYRAAAAALTAIAQTATGAPGLGPYDLLRITRFTSSAAALLLQTGLS